MPYFFPLPNYVKSQYSVQYNTLTFKVRVTLAHNPIFCPDMKSIPPPRDKLVDKKIVLLTNWKSSPSRLAFTAHEDLSSVALDFVLVDVLNSDVG